ncbi:uncharacterized protein L969DRAFT_101477 [Mixia osmundae IAM 14324]|uniref:diacylglycerol O-acyltransferase n=1 Tax=Mixia osmundae (strain CBS 9802 / IAM 14324 / JCM 22182 / KY 12970) TaxID=764103 RepID=G7DXE4_MIXOS|nr:uncharacterized protein L969DRAFT_101477 [Mixia osmundae IAM 14324]KEI41252.1 hypothetical protein L969DRAFT_101477 [Mixia osmundae IAM 14324]GAA95254.1 hypothetical protein E5Q_01910 [Mixia osmundae IAM 14324]
MRLSCRCCEAAKAASEAGRPKASTSRHPDALPAPELKAALDTLTSFLQGHTAKYQAQGWRASAAHLHDKPAKHLRQPYRHRYLDFAPLVKRIQGESAQTRQNRYATRGDVPRARTLATHAATRTVDLPVASLSWQAHYPTSTYRFQAGDLLVTFAQGEYTLCIVLSVPSQAQVLALLGTGRIKPIAISSATWVLPAFEKDLRLIETIIKPFAKDMEAALDPLVAAAYKEDEDLCISPDPEDPDAENLEAMGWWIRGLDPTTSDYDVDIAASLTASRKLIQRIRRFDIDSSRAVRDVYQMGVTALPLFADAHDQIKLDQALGWIKLGSGNKLSIDDKTSLAVHVNLSRNVDHVLLDPVQHVRSQTHIVVDSAYQEDAMMIAAMVESNHPDIKAFVDKASRCVEAFESQRYDPDKPADSRARSLGKWTDSEMRILRCMKEASVQRRYLQENSKPILFSSLLRQIRPWPGQSPLPSLASTLSDLRTLLRALFVFAPWEHASQELLSMMHADLPALPKPTDLSIAPDLYKEDGLFARDLLEPIRYDFGDQRVLVIDDAGAEELDDGVSTEPGEPTEDGKPTQWIHVHIADPTATLPLGHPLAKDAIRRLSTIYTHGKSARAMLDEGVSKAHSLEAAKDGKLPVLTFSARLDASGVSIETLVRPAYIRNVQRYTYAALDKHIGTAPLEVGLTLQIGKVQTIEQRPEQPVLHADGAIMDVLLQYGQAVTSYKVSCGLTQATIAKPKLEVINGHELRSLCPIERDIRPFTGLPSLRVTFPPNEYDSASGGADGRYDGAQVIATFMSMACEMAGQYLRRRSVEAIYLSRPHGYARDASILPALDFNARHPCTGRMPIREILKTKRMLYSLTFNQTSLVPSGWPLMGIPDDSAYVRVTSPLRRAVDLVSHWQLKQQLAKDANLPWPEQEAPRTEFVHALLIAYDRHSRAVRLALTRYDTALFFYVFEQAWRDLKAGKSKNEELSRLLDSLTAMPTLDATSAGGDRSTITQIFVPELGLYCSLKENFAPLATRTRTSSDLDSDRFPVEISEFDRLSDIPVLTMSKLKDRPKPASPSTTTEAIESNGEAKNPKQLAAAAEISLPSQSTSPKTGRSSSIQFVPLSIPRARRLQTAAVVGWGVSLPFALFLFFMLCSIPPFWPIIIVYLIWALGFDTAQDNGGRPSAWLRGHQFFKLFAGYYPVSLIKTTELPAERTYLFGYHPHGIIGIGAVSNFGSDATNFSKIFPGIKPHLMTLSSNFQIPLYREFLMAMGICSVSYKSCSHILRQGPGSSLTIVVGGATESLSAHPGTNDLTLKKRLGFIKLAIREGADLVPVFSFGENDIFDQLANEKGTRLYTLQKKFQSVFGFTLPIVHGRGVFNYNLGLLPFRHPITSVVGRPVKVTQNAKPSIEELYEVQGRYIEELTRIWDDYKDIYAPHRKRELSIVS